LGPFPHRPSPSLPRQSVSSRDTDQQTPNSLTSNAIPATSWLLCHLLRPSSASLLAKVQAEVLHAYNPNTKFIDVNTLQSSAPYLNSALNETLRLYVDVLVTREAKSDIVIQGYSVRKGEIIMAPSFLGHRDPTEWDTFSSDVGRKMPPEDVWFGERFLRSDDDEDQESGGEKGEKEGPSLNTKDTAGKYFPFGGGQNMCPGRTFARQEVLGAVAAFLISFDIGFVSYVDRNGKVVGDDGDEKGFPVVMRQFAGTGVVTAEGDVRLRIRRRGM
jgi:cytochrome P450